MSSFCFRLLPANQLPTTRLQTCSFSRCAARAFSSSSGNVHFLDAENATDLAADVSRLRPQHLMLETCPVRWKNLQIDAGYRPQLDAINTLHGGLLSRDLLELRKRFVDHGDEQEERHGIKLHPCDRAYRKTQNEVARALFLRPWILLSYARYAKHRLARVSREVSGTPGGIKNANAGVHDQQLQPLRLPTAMASVLVARRAEHFAREIAALSPTRSETVVVCCATRDFREAVERAVLTGRGDYGGVAGSVVDGGFGETASTAGDARSSVAGTDAGPMWPFFFSFLYLVLPVSLIVVTAVSAVKGALLVLVAGAQSFVALLKDKLLKW